MDNNDYIRQQVDETISLLYTLVHNCDVLINIAEQITNSIKRGGAYFYLVTEAVQLMRSIWQRSYPVNSGLTGNRCLPSH